MKPKPVFLALGTNIGDRLVNLRAALHALPPKVQPVRISPVYETPPWGYLDQPTFLNMAAEVRTNLSPHDLLTYLKATEQALGRVNVVRNGPRLIDLDILFYNDLVLKEEALEIPHPRMAERAFVLVPLADLAPDFIHPLLKQPVSSLLARLDTTGIELYTITEDFEMVPKTDQPEMPQEFIDALDQAPEASQKFFSLPPSHQREYLEYILEAKKPETRLRRISKVIETLSQPRPHP